MSLYCKHNTRLSTCQDCINLVNHVGGSKLLTVEQWEAYLIDMNIVHKVNEPSLLEMAGPDYLRIGEKA